jgi:hypothetical protein
LRALLNGQREEDALCDALNHAQSLIITIILRCLTDPGAEQTLFPGQT